MQWIAQNWIWLVLTLGALYFFSRHWRYAPGGSGHSGHEHSEHVQQHEGMAVDPVSGSEVSTTQALTAYYRGRAYYFENAATRERFEAAPERYVHGAAGDSAASQHRRHCCC